MLIFTNCAKFHFKLERTIIKSSMFEPAHFIAAYLPQHFNSLFLQTPTSHSLLSLLSSLKNFFHSALKLYHPIDNPIHLISFLNTHFSLQLELSPLYQPIHSNLCVLAIIVQSQSQQKRQVIKLSSQILAFLFSIHVQCSKKNISKPSEDRLVAKLLNLSQKLRFQLEISDISTGTCQVSYDEIIDSLFKIGSEFISSPSAHYIIENVTKSDTFNVLDTTRVNIISGIKLTQKNDIEKFKQSDLKTTTKKNEQFSPSLDGQTGKSEAKEKVKMFLARKIQQMKGKKEQGMVEAKKRMEEYSKMKKSKPIFKDAVSHYKERTIYQARKGKFVARDGLNQTRSISSSFQIFDYSTQMSSKSQDDYQRLHYPSQYQSEMGPEESDDDVLVPSTPRLERRTSINRVVSCRLQFSEQ